MHGIHERRDVDAGEELAGGQLKLDPGDVGPVEHDGLEALVVVLFGRGEQEVDRVRERRVRDVVQKPRDPLLRVGPEPSK